jgi:hypothetical protein
MFGRKQSESVVRPARKVTPIGGIANESSKGAEAPSKRLGETTLEFFKEGEQHEAAEWTDVQLPPDDEPEKDPKIKFKSFDKIAKKRSSTVVLLVLTVGLAVAVSIGVVAALRTEHVVSSSLGPFFGLGGRASAARVENTPAPAVLPPPILLPDAGRQDADLPDAQTDASTGTGTGTSTGTNP